jgi:subtilisin family serine protease
MLGYSRPVKLNLVMRRLIFIAAIIWSWWCVSVSAQTSALMPATNSAKPYRADRIMIQPKQGISPARLGSFHQQHKSRLLGNFARMRNLQILEVPAGETVESLITKYQHSGLVEFAEPDYLVYADATLPNDSYFTNGLLWGLNNYGQNSGTPHADIDATDGWDVLTSASNIVVAVLDSGIRATHQDLASNMWVNPLDGGHGYNAFTGTNDPTDVDGHGTLVAGVLGAVGNNGVGVCGVAWQVQMMACKCLSGGTGSDSTVTACIDYALANGAKIINGSFDSPTPSLAVSNAIVAAQAAGVIWVASAGNNTYNVEVNPSYPTCYGIDNIVSVAYTTRNDALGAFSNYGATHVALAAPGDQIYSTISFSDTSYYPSSNLGLTLAGTSYSAPYVSGTCALLMAQYPADSYQQTITRLLSSTDPLPSLAGKCRTGGRLNLRRALRTILITAIPSTNSGAFKLRVSGGLNRTCVVEATTNLAVWSPVFTNISSPNGTFDFVDDTTTNSTSRFFRATAAP